MVAEAGALPAAIVNRLQQEAVAAETDVAEDDRRRIIASVAGVSVGDPSLAPLLTKGQKLRVAA
jgi:hypothetical protein